VSAQNDRRKDPRAPLQVPIQVHSGFDRVQTPQSALGTTTDASSSGVGLLLRHPVSVGQIVRLELVGAARAGPFRLGGRSTRAYAVVRNVRSETEGVRVGVKFFDFVEADEPARPSPDERRRSPRYAIPVNFIVQQVHNTGAKLQEWLSVAEDLSHGGARLVACLQLNRGDLVRLRETEGGFETRAEVTHSALHSDGLVRLHLRFLDHTPDHVVPLPS
jgi:hypothetical protein